MSSYEYRNSHYKDKRSYDRFILIMEIPFLDRPSILRRALESSIQSLMPKVTITSSPRQHDVVTWLVWYSTTICKLVDLIPALHQSDCRIPNWVSAKTVHSSSTHHGQSTDCSTNHSSADRIVVNSYNNACVSCIMYWRLPHLQWRSQTNVTRSSLWTTKLDWRSKRLGKLVGMMGRGPT